MNIEIPFDIGQKVWAVDKYWSHHDHPLQCPNCDGSGKVSISKSVAMECKRCNGEGRLFIDGMRESRVYFSEIHDIKIQVGHYMKPTVPVITYQFRVNWPHGGSSFETKNVFATQAEANGFAAKANESESSEFEDRKAESLKVVEMTYP